MLREYIFTHLSLLQWTVKYYFNSLPKLFKIEIPTSRPISLQKMNLLKKKVNFEFYFIL